MITAAGWISSTIAAHWPAISEPISTSPWRIASASLPAPSASILSGSFARSSSSI